MTEGAWDADPLTPTGKGTDESNDPLLLAENAGGEGGVEGGDGFRTVWKLGLDQTPYQPGESRWIATGRG